MICPKCGKPFNNKTNYNPTTKQNDLPYTTHSHSLYLSKLIENPETRKHTIRIENKNQKFNAEILKRLNKRLK